MLTKSVAVMSLSLAGYVSALNGGIAQAALITDLPPEVYSAQAITAIGGAGGDTSMVEQTTASPYPAGNTCTIGDTISCSAIGPGGLATVDISAARDYDGPPAIDPSITVIATAAAGRFPDAAGRLVDQAGSQATASVAYYFDMTDAPGYNPSNAVADVPLTLSGAISINPTQDQAAAEGLASVASASITVYSEQGDAIFSDSTNGAYNQNFSLEPYRQYEIVLAASASAGDGSTAKAVIDPLLTLDPSIAADYMINYSPNLLVVPSTAVPELPVWAMMLAGLGALGLIHSRRQRRSTT
jgi:hypothetical protein